MKAIVVGLLCLATGMAQAVPLYQCPLTVSGYAEGKAALADFPVLVRISTAIDQFNYGDCAAGGADISFTSEDGETVYPHEVDTWNPDGESLVWVKLPSMAHGTKFLFRWADPNPLANDPKTVWTDYVGVWHFNENGGLSAADSSPNGFHGSVLAEGADAADYTAVTVAGQTVGAGRQCTAQSLSFTMPDYSELKVGGNFTASGIFKMEARTAYESFFNKKQSWNVGNGFQCNMQNSDEAFFICGSGSDKTYSNKTLPNVKSNWTHLTLAYNGTSVTVYNKGVSVASFTINDTGDVARDMKVAGFKGVVDEVRVRKGATSAEWVKAEYEVATKSDYLTAGTMEVLSSEGIVVSSDGPRYGVVSPDYGRITEPEAGTTCDFSCTVATQMLNEAGTTRAVCTGWELRRLSDGELIKTSSSEGEQTFSCSHTYVQGEGVELMWRWQIQHLVTTKTATTGGGTVEPSEAWVVKGEDVTVTFTPDATHGFYKWAGDVAAASEKTNPLTVTVDGPKTIEAHSMVVAQVTTGEELIAAVAAASATDPSVIEIADGDIYLTETLKLTKPITVRGAGMGKTFLRRDTSVAQVRGLYLSNADAVVEGMSLSGFYVKDSTDSTSTSAGLRMTAGTVRNCEFNGIASACNTGSDWNKGSPCATVSGASSKVIGCVFHGTAGGAMTGAALWLKDNAVADTCLFYGNSVNSTSIVQIDSGTVRNCTIVGNTIASSCAVYIAGTGSYLKDSIVYGNNGTSASSGSSVQGHGYDIKAANASTLTSRSLNNFTDDPGFVDFANGDYRLRPGSPCINAGAYGAETTALTSTDVSGAQTRQFGSATDIGAYECDPGTTPACFFTCNSSQALVGDELAINLYSHMGGESPVYTIDWGDGLPAEVVTGTAAFHAYSAPGNYTVALFMSGAEEYRVVNALTAMPKDLFVAYDGKGTAPYASPDSPAAYIEDALACTVDGCTIWLQDGDYKLKTSSTLALRKNVKIRSLSGDPRKVTLTTQTKDSAKLLILDSADAGVYGITLFGGYAGGQNSYYGSCIEITSHGGVVSNCVVHSGKANGWGGAAAGIKMAAGKVTHCVVSNHSAHCAGNYKGSAVYASGGSVENCLISENKSSGANGYTVHLAGGKMYNCTVAGNSHTAYAGVLVSSKDSKIVNCAIAENTSTDKSGDFVGIYGYEGITASQASGCFDHCASPSKINDNCFDGNMGFVAAAKKDFHLVGNSACRDKGTAEGLDLAELDLDGNARVDENSGIVDIGCYEFHSTGLSAAISSDPAEKDGAVTVLSPHRVAFTAVVDGGEAKSCRWFVNGIEQEGEATTAFTTNFTASGTYSVTAKISDGQNEYDAGNAVAVKVYPSILYVDKNSTNPVAPYETEATAATFLEDALAAATDNCEIRIAPETYPAKSGAISVGKGVTIRGMGATPADVVLTRKNKSTNHRILTLNHEGCWITGLTLDNGYLANQSEHGAGVCIEGRGGTVSNCVIRNCQGATMDCYGGGACLLVANALVTHCVITNCYVSSSSPAGSAEHGGLGVYMSAGSLRDSLIAFCGSNGTSYDSGLKGQDGTIAIRGGTVVNCTVASNVNATCSGIRARGGKVINTIISANRVTTSVLGDTATVMAGKVAGDSASTTFENCLADKDVDGKFAVEDPAQTFLRPRNGNFRLRTGSKAIDAGDASAVTSTVDLRGNPRVQCGAVDLGCYEKKIGLTVLVK